MSSGIHLLAVKRTFVFGKKDIINWYLDWLVVWSRIGPITCYRCHAIVTHYRHKIFIENIPHLQGEHQNRTRVSKYAFAYPFFWWLDIIFPPFLVVFNCTWGWAWPSKISLCSACLWRHKIRDRVRVCSFGYPNPVCHNSHKPSRHRQNCKLKNTCVLYFGLSHGLSPN